MYWLALVLLFPFLCSVKILMIHQHFKDPKKGGAIRSYYLAKALVDSGHRVVLITSSSEGQGRIEDVEGIKVHNLKIAYDNRFKFYARALTFIRFMFGAAVRARRFRDFDCCYAISVPLTVGLTARWIRFRFGIPYFFEVGDLWPDAPIQMGFVRNHFFKNFLYAVEHSIYKNARAIVALSPSIQSAVEKKISGKTIHLVPNMADCDFYKPEKKRSDLELKFGVNGKFVVSYIGAVGVANGLDYFLECANASRKADLPIHFILCGDGAMLEGLQSNAKRLGLPNLAFIDFVNRDGVREIMNVTDAAFISYKSVPILETGSPNKFFDGLAGGKLIVINFGGWIKEEIENHHCGIFVDPQQPIDFVKKIGPFVSSVELLSQYKGASRKLAETKYSRRKLSDIFSKLFS